MKKTNKKVTKTVKPAFIVDLTNVETPTELYAAFGLAKQDANLPMTDDELIAIVNIAVNTTFAALQDVFNKLPFQEFDIIQEFDITNGEKLIFDEKGNIKVKKPNIFRRFWNWITRKK